MIPNIDESSQHQTKCMYNPTGKEIAKYTHNKV